MYLINAGIFMRIKEATTISYGPWTQETHFLRSCLPIPDKLELFSVHISIQNL